VERGDFRDSVPNIMAQQNQDALPGRALKDVETIADHFAALTSLAGSLRLLAAARDRKAALGVVKKLTGLKAGAAVKLLDAVDAVRTFASRVGKGPSESFDILTGIIEQSAPKDWDVAILQSWRNGKDILIQLMDADGPLAALSKSEALQLSFEHVWLYGSIYSDIRPTFSVSGEQVLRAALIHNLAICYRKSGQQMEFHVALSYDDLKELEQVVKRALTKGKAIANSLNQWPLEGGSGE
jgi:hypothetical protein